MNQDRSVLVLYRNHEGETSWRRIIPFGCMFTSNQWHPEEQQLLHCWDCDKETYRNFAFRDILYVSRGPLDEVKKYDIEKLVLHARHIEELS